MFWYFPGNYSWSSAVNLAMTCGGQLGDLDKWLSPLRDREASEEAWLEAWTDAAKEQERLGSQERANGFEWAAGERFLRACLYHAMGERHVAPGPEKQASYAEVLRCFDSALGCGGLGLERISAPSPDGPLPGYVEEIPGGGTDRHPAIIFVDGFDVLKETLFMLMRGEFARRGIVGVYVDTPGVGEVLRRGGVPSRPDYEVPVGAVVDFLEGHHAVDPERIGVLGISLGGYYAPRAAAYEPRLKCCVAWGGNLDYGELWERRWQARSDAVSVPFFQLPWVTGTDSMEQALARIHAWNLTPVLPDLKAPFLLLHGENDRQVSVEDARRAFDLAGSRDKTLHIFPRGEAGEEHCQTDALNVAQQIIGDWCRDRLSRGTAER